MRQWRVGSVSMGALLVFLGILLLLSQFQDLNLIAISRIWLPIVLIVLGLEIVIYFFFSNQENRQIKYDMFSILFIFFVGMVSIGGYLVSTSGVLAAFENVVDAEEIEGALPLIEHQTDNRIERVVIQSSDRQVSLEGNTSDHITIFGTFQSNHLGKEDLTQDQVASIHKSGNTLYVQVHKAPSKQGIGYGYTQFNTTISVPTDIDVEVRSRIDQVNLDMNDIKADWYIDRAYDVSLKDKEQADLMLRATVKQENSLSEHPIDVQKETANVDEKTEPDDNKVDQTYGQGTHKLIFDQVENLIVRD